MSILRFGRKQATPEARGERGMVASAEPLATEIGVDILKRGGNAVDAAVAVGFALAVTFPQAGNLGGGGFLLLRQPDGQAFALDYRETAPAGATRDVFLDLLKNPIQGEGGSLVGYRASGVPGTVSGLSYAFYKYGSGRVTWADVIEPARKLAAEGFPVPKSLADSLAGERVRALLGRNPESKRIFLNGGNGWKEGDRFQQPELAATLARIQKDGQKDFYKGETARLIAAEMARNRGLITARDLERYVILPRRPINGAYRGHPIVTMPPPSSGGVALFQMLGMLEGFDLRALGHDNPRRLHLLIEVMRRAFADRAEYLGDPVAVKIPLGGLLSPTYLHQRRDTISPDKATPSDTVTAGKLPPMLPRESWETTHFTVIDGDGRAVSNTYTLNGAYGSGVTIAGTGILMNNEMDDFAIKPGVPNQFGLIQSARNAVAPGRRPLSSMTPTLVLRPGDRRVLLAIGSPGGPTIINTVLQVILNVLDHQMGVAEAIAAPRLHHQWLPDEVVYEPEGFSAETLNALREMGHRLTEKPRRLGDAQGVLVDPATNVRIGASDPRGSGGSMGV